MADDMRAAADLASRWASCRDGWKDPDLSAQAMFELDERLNDYAETGAAVRSTDVFLAKHAVETLCSWILSLRQLPNAPDGFDVREFVSRVMLQPMNVEPYTAEEIASFGKTTEG